MNSIDNLNEGGGAYAAWVAFVPGAQHDGIKTWAAPGVDGIGPIADDNSVPEIPRAGRDSAGDDRPNIHCVTGRHIRPGRNHYAQWPRHTSCSVFIAADRWRIRPRLPINVSSRREKW